MAKYKTELTEEERQQALIDLIDHYGEDDQLNMVMEECAELIQSVNKFKRFRKKENGYRYRDDMIREVADVLIMIDQLMIILQQTERPDAHEILKIRYHEKLMDAHVHVCSLNPKKYMINDTP